MLDLILKMLRDIKNNRIQFASVFFMALLGIMIYSGIEGVWLGMDKNCKQFYDESHAVTEWVYGRALTEDDLSEIKKLDYVDNGTLAMQFDCSHIVREGGSQKEYHLQVNTFKDTDINIPDVVNGSGISVLGNDVCWLDNNYAAEHNISVGDIVNLRYLAAEHKVKVEGTVISPEYVSYTGSQTTLNPDHKLYGYCYINEQTAKNFGGGVKYNMIKLITDGKRDSVIKDVTKILGKKYIICYDSGNYQGVQEFTSHIYQLKSMSFMFSALFILLSLLSIQTTMKRLVETQRTQIGTLKALGFTDLHILIHYAAYGFLISATGSTIGFVLGSKLITPILINVQKYFYTIPKWSGKNSVISYAIIGATIVTCTFITFLACRGSIHLVPAEAMRNKQIKVKGSELRKTVGFLSFEWKWSVRYILRNKIRTIVGVIGVAGCLVLLIASVGLYDSLNYANHYLYGTQYTYKNKVVLNSMAGDVNMEKIKDELLHDYQESEEQIIQIKTVDTVYPSSITVLEKGHYVSFYKNVLKHVKQIIMDDNSMLISAKLADELNISKGQTIKIELAGDNEYKNAVITDVVYMPAPQGLIASKECFSALGFNFAPNCLFTNVKDVGKLRDINGVSEITSLDEQYKSAETILESAMMIVILLIMAGIALSSIILFNLGMLNFTERMREYSTLKVLGFEDNEIKSIIMKDTIITSMLGLLFGIPLGIWFLRLYVGTVSTISFDYYPYISWYFFVAVIAASLLCSFAVNYVVVSKIKHLDMVEALKSVE